MEVETGVIAGDTWQARLYQETDKVSLIRLSTSHYGEKEQAREEYVDWLYKGSPAGMAILTVCEEIASSEIVGFAFHVPIQVRFRDADALCHMGCNALVQPDYRRQGIYAVFNQLVDSEIQDSLFIYGFPKPRALVPHQKVGKYPVTVIPLLVRPLDMKKLAQARFSNPLLRLGLTAGWAVAAKTLWRSRRAKTVDRDLHVTQENEFDEGFDRFWERVADKYPIMIKRDCQFLTWRFRGIPFRSYEILAARCANELVGYAVLRHTEIEGLPTGLIMDLLVEAGPRGDQAGPLLAEEAIRRFKQTGMVLTGCLMLPHTQEYQILRRAGYVDAPERFSPQSFRLNIKSLSRRAPDEFLARSDHWFITMANHDAV